MQSSISRPEWKGDQPSASVSALGFCIRRNMFVQCLKTYTFPDKDVLYDYIC